MKRLPSFLLLLIIRNTLLAQNLVPNPGFEQYSVCPTGLSQVSTCTGWGQTNTADYFNACHTSGIVGVPLNSFGGQTAASGNGYMGFYTYAGSSTYKEYIHRGIDSIRPGALYEVAMSVSLSDSSGYGTNDLGVMFSRAGPGGNPLTPQVMYTNYGAIINKSGWSRLTKNFISTDFYTGMRIGGYLDNNTMTRVLAPPGGTSQAYYYVDDVEVRLLSTLFFLFPDTTLCAGDTIVVSYGLVPGSFNPGNIFTLQLSNASGSFANPVVLSSVSSTIAGTLKGVIPVSTPTGGGYKLRIVSSSPFLYASTYDRNIGIGNAPPAKPVALGQPFVCSTDTLWLSATTTTPNVSWSWIGPNSYNSQQQNPVIVHPSPVGPGFYYVNAYIYGCESRDTVPVTAVRTPNKPIATSLTSPCVNDSIKLSVNNNFTGVTFSWQGPGNFTANIQKPIIPNGTLSMSGDYIVTASYYMCTAEDTVTVTVKPIPSVQAFNNGPLCSGATLNLTLNATQGSTFSWTGPGGFTSNLIVPNRSNVISSWSGIYDVTATFNGCKNTASTTVTIAQMPEKPVSSNNSPVCVDGEILLSATSTQPGLSYVWGGPASYYSGSKNATRYKAKLTEGGQYYVHALLNGCKSQTDTTFVTVIKGPSVLIYPNPGDKICPSWKAGFAAVPKNAGTAPTFEWYKNGVATGGTGLSYVSPTVATGDTFYVRMTAGTGCSTPIGSNSVEITVLPVHTPPTIEITATPGEKVWPYVEVVFKAKTGNSGANPGYQWVRNGVDISNALDSVWSATDLKTGDTICCRVTSNFLCAEPREVEDCIVMTVDLGVDDFGNENGLHVYPNPNTGRFAVEATESGTLYISNLNGQDIGQFSIKKGRNNIELPEGIADGVYVGRLGGKAMRINVMK